MIAMNIVLDGDRAFPELADGRKVVHLQNTITVTALAAGMGSGKPSVSFRFDLEDGTAVLAETSLALFLTAADALKAKHGDPRR